MEKQEIIDTLREVIVGVNEYGSTEHAIQCLIESMILPKGIEAYDDVDIIEAFELLVNSLDEVEQAA